MKLLEWQSENLAGKHLSSVILERFRKFPKVEFHSKFQLSFLCAGCCPFANFLMFGSIIGYVFRCLKDKLYGKSLQKRLFVQAIRWEIEEK